MFLDGLLRAEGCTSCIVQTLLLGLKLSYKPTLTQNLKPQTPNPKP